MSKFNTSQILQKATENLTAAPKYILQRKYDCDTHIIAGDKCDSCRKNQEKSSGRDYVSGVEDEMLQLNHSSFGHDFSGTQLSGNAPKRIQTKLTVSDSNDKYEQEADRIADAIMSTAEITEQKSLVGVTAARDTQVSRDCSDEDDETCLSRMSEEISDTEEEFLQKKESSNQAKLNSNTESRIQAIRGRGQPLAASARSFFEPRFGYDLSRVRVHTGGALSESDLRRSQQGKDI